ncbi:AIPR family protein [Pseudomonas petrae]|uniref:AIPR family protein n=1 Tax=Pseudomonas petrae TaxID=2912190 RepID=UPI001F475DE0|nr:AIPR family protein [Pseudomonas petrae]MCF7558682.1 AIPR family protein [Pseudomonas petrae]
MAVQFQSLYVKAQVHCSINYGIQGSMMDKITGSLLSTFVKQNELSTNELSTQFEHFVNYAITSKVFRGSFELDDVHVGSGGDCAIDGLCIIVNGRLITDEDVLKDVVDNSGYLDADITFVQSKTSSNFDGSSIGSFIHGVKDFLSDAPQLVQNTAIKKMKYVWELIVQMSDHMVNRRPNCRLFYVSTGKWVGDDNLVAIINSGKKEIDQLSLFDAVSVDALGATELQRMYQETKNRLSVTVNFQNRITLPDIEGVAEAYLGVIPFDEYVKLIQDESGTIYSIFDDNVRDFQGGNVVNAKIKNTLDQGKFDLFCVLNNGVTVVAGSLTPAGNRFTIRDYQVVNGCQTSHVLHECRKIEGIEKVYVPMKIIVTDDEDIKTNITLATNSQTEVRTEQLEALSSFQKKLELYYAAEKNTIQLYYERRSQQYNSFGDVKRTQIISIPTQIKSFASMFLNSPHLVSGYYGTIVKRFSGKIFNEDHKYSAYYVSGLAYYRIEQMFRSGELDSGYKKFRFQFMLIVRMLVIGEALDYFNSNAFDKACERLKSILLDDDKSAELFKQAQTVFDNSKLDKTKRQYKAESDTDLVIEAFRTQKASKA